jgi:hypothetical protein
LFFTFWGFGMITRSRTGDLKLTMLGNTATHVPGGARGLPGITAMATHQMRGTRSRRGCSGPSPTGGPVAPFRDLERSARARVAAAMPSG